MENNTTGQSLISNSTEKLLNVRLLGDKILIEEEGSNKEKVTASGIVLTHEPGSSSRTKTGVIVLTGPGVRDSKNKLLPMQCSVGDKVVYSYGETVTINHKDYIMLHDFDVLAILT